MSDHINDIPIGERLAKAADYVRLLVGRGISREEAVARATVKYSVPEDRLIGL